MSKEDESQINIMTWSLRVFFFFFFATGLKKKTEQMETRTKESNMYASIWTIKPTCVTKVRGGRPFKFGSTIDRSFFRIDSS